MLDRGRMSRIGKLMPGRELPFTRDIFETSESLHRNLHRACAAISERTGAQFRVTMTPAGAIVRRVSERKAIDASVPSVADRAGREARTWLDETRIAGLEGYARETRIHKARACLRRVARVTGETMREVLARLDLSEREIAILREDPLMNEFGELQ